jgi:glycine/D-amino acid oxidase-like deaminating enzyme
VGARSARTADVVIVGGDQTPVRGLYVAAGMSGHGFKLSPAVGRMMADLITHGTSALAPLPAFRLDRFAPAAHDGSGAFSHSYLR